MKRVKLLLLLIIFHLATEVKLSSQDIPDWRARLILSDSGYVDFLQYFQIWNTVTLKSPKTSSVPRIDTYIRRARFGLGGSINEKAFFYAGFTYDGIGKDSLSISPAAPNPSDNTAFFIRDVFFTYKFNTYFNLTIGYFRPRAVKESIYTSAFNISQEKGQANFQPRVHMVGRSIGRETGINIGGLKRGKKLSLLYDFGFFDTNHPLIQGDNSIWWPLLTARTVLMIGDPEFEDYRLVYSQSGFTERKGLSIAANATFQRETNLFRNNLIYGVDAQLNYGALDLLAEYVWLYRESKIKGGSTTTTIDHCYVVKAAWNFKVNTSQLVQITAMYTATLPEKTNEIESINQYTKANYHAEVALGLNWLVKRNRLKLGLHFVQGNTHYKAANGDNIGKFVYINPSIQFMM